MIIISHRLSSLVNSDAILVLERGKVVDMGKHEELLERCEIYSGLWHQQNRHIAAASAPLGREGPPVSPKPPPGPTVEHVPVRDRRDPRGAASRSARLDPDVGPFVAGRRRPGCHVCRARSTASSSAQAARSSPRSPPVVFQALDPSIIKSIDVKEGQRVEKGQVLATLDPTFAAADVNQLNADRQPGRPDRPRSGRTRRQPPCVPARTTIQTTPEYEKLQRGFSSSTTAQYNAQFNSFDQQIAPTEATIQKYTVRRVRYKDEEQIVNKQIEDMHSTLQQHGTGSLLNLLTATVTKLENISKSGI